MGKKRVDYHTNSWNHNHVTTHKDTEVSSVCRLWFTQVFPTPTELCWLSTLMCWLPTEADLWRERTWTNTGNKQCPILIGKAKKSQQLLSIWLGRNDCQADRLWCHHLWLVMQPRTWEASRQHQEWPAPSYHNLWPFLRGMWRGFASYTLKRETYFGLDQP